jgi:protein-L-isoaspartate O-methyltransferase
VGVTVTDRLVEAIHVGRLYETARSIAGDPGVGAIERERAERAIAVCEQIGRVCEQWRRELVDTLRRGGCEVDAGEPIGPRQRHTIELTVADYEAARRAAGLLERNGFEPWQSWVRGAERSASRFASELVVATTSDATIVVRLRWGGPPSRSRARRAFTPTAGDWSMVDLPTSLWFGYSVVRPIRLLLERVGIRARHDDSLGPFLSTPDQLVVPLLEFGGIGPDDCVLDIGCGDGRIVVAAAEHSGCRAIGVERSDDLVERARRRAADHGVGGLVDIVQGDGRTVDVDEATLVVMFLSIRVVAELVPALLGRLRPGARLVIHEQSRLPVSMQPPPDESVALITDGSVTVAHRWTVR